MNTCDTCHYWDVKEYVASDPRRQCNNPRIGNRMDGDSMCVEGYEWECITTGPKFGCVHHATVPVVTKREDKP